MFVDCHDHGETGTLYNGLAHCSVAYGDCRAGCLVVASTSTFREWSPVAHNYQDYTIVGGESGREK